MIEITANDIADLMHKHRGELLRFLSQRLRCSEAAQDIFQETFIRYLGYDGKNKIENPRAFIFRIAANLATDHLRSRSRQAVQETEDFETEALQENEPQTLSAEQTVMSQQQFEHLVSALSELSPKCREVFILLKIKHYSYAEVEQRLGISQTMIFKYLRQAMTHCRHRLDGLD